MSDVVLDGEQVTILCNNLNVQGHDFLLSSSARRRPSGPQFRRALVHAENDSLAMNFAGDYPGGVILNGVAELFPLRQPGGLPLSVPNLVVRGGISYEVGGIDPHGHHIRVTVVVDEELRNLQSQIDELVAKVTALEARP